MKLIINVVTAWLICASVNGQTITTSPPSTSDTQPVSTGPTTSHSTGKPSSGSETIILPKILSDKCLKKSEKFANYLTCSGGFNLTREIYSHFVEDITRNPNAIASAIFLRICKKVWCFRRFANVYGTCMRDLFAFNGSSAEVSDARLAEVLNFTREFSCSKYGSGRDDFCAVRFPELLYPSPGYILKELACAQEENCTCECRGKVLEYLIKYGCCMNYLVEVLHVYAGPDFTIYEKCNIKKPKDCPVVVPYPI